jgi:hypothetical protein
MEYNVTNVAQVTGQGCWQTVQSVSQSFVILVSGSIVVNNESFKPRRKRDL